MLSANISDTLPFTRKRANNAMVKSTISRDLETIMDFRLKRPNQWRCRQWFRSMPSVLALLIRSFPVGTTAAYVFQ